MKKRYIIMLLTLLPLVGCQDWLDVNTDPNKPTDPKIELLLPTVEVNLFNSTAGYMSASIGGATGTLAHHMVNKSINGYNVETTSHCITQPWSSLFMTEFSTLNIILDNAESNNQLQYKGVAQTLKAVTSILAVDMWGDVPFAEAGLAPKIMYPKYDKQKEIYVSCFSLLDDAKKNLLDKKTAIVPSLAQGDVIYGGDVDKWVKFINSWKLRMINQIKGTELFDTYKGQLDALITENNFIDSDSQFELVYGKSITPENRNPMYAAEYDDAEDTDYFISHWFYQSMQGDKGFIGFLEGITDPRVPYYFYRQFKDKGKEVPYSVEMYKFHTFQFGYKGEYESTNFKGFTTLGVYVCGGKYDDGTLKMANSKDKDLDGSGVVPTRIFNEHDVDFILAELALSGKATVDAKSYLEKGIKSAFSYCNKMAAYDADVPLIKADVSDKYVKDISDKYVAASDQVKLEVVMTEKWIADFGNSNESYCDHRRTGFPKVWDPESDSSKDTYATHKYPNVLPYSNRSVISNITIKDKGYGARDLSQTYLFWSLKK
ncbi:SusD/RagB family nutrient-binding outer membrane lipoprotein [Halosquirtibacter xylanolyticus]|uniref:SusD/RagB family nutrient-binding outer membrane lipoprotein n=1 Tax=Halosquirtibacter xylanolyticus TaxID=3374599 RepID=UPI003748D1B4|nr:SusD/RagB family nutrient-binding outer membrane lipoprotein [Prolixibacteraceae bacterium]